MFIFLFRKILDLALNLFNISFLFCFVFVFVFVLELLLKLMSFSGWEHSQQQLQEIVLELYKNSYK